MRPRSTRWVPSPGTSPTSPSCWRRSPGTIPPTRPPRRGRCPPTGRRSTARSAASRAAGFGTEVKRRIMLGTYALSAGYYDAYYLKAQQIRTLIRMDFQKVFETCDALVTPVAPTTAFRLGEKTADPLTMYLSDIFTISVNLAGLPALALPCGFDSAGLPIGLQVIGRPFDERSEEHTSELQSLAYLVCRLLL